MKNILIFSIKPKHAENIFSGKKTIELRRIKPKDIYKDSIVIVYVSSPIQELWGIFTVKKVIQESLPDLWLISKKSAKITEKEFQEYFKDRSNGTAIFIKKFLQFQNPVSLENLKKFIKNFRPPQSFRYVKKEDILFQELLKNNL